MIKQRLIRNYRLLLTLIVTPVYRSSTSDSEDCVSIDDEVELDVAGTLETGMNHDLVYQDSAEGNELTKDEQDRTQEEDKAEPPRYPRRICRPPPDWFMVTSGTRSVDITVTTSDEPTLQEALNATPDERDLWLSAIQ